MLYVRAPALCVSWQLACITMVALASLMCLIMDHTTCALDKWQICIVALLWQFKACRRKMQKSWSDLHKDRTSMVGSGCCEGLLACWIPCVLARWLWQGPGLCGSTQKGRPLQRKIHDLASPVIADGSAVFQWLETGGHGISQLFLYTLSLSLSQHHALHSPGNVPAGECLHPPVSSPRHSSRTMWPSHRAKPSCIPMTWTRSRQDSQLMESIVWRTNMLARYCIT